jgi:ABC-type Fe3+/spermidine/putrescine transport system ATPase subunit
MTAPAIRLEGVRVTAGSFVLGPLDLTIDAGEHVLLMGASGTGKSLLLETIIGSRPLREGRVLLRGTDVAGVPVHLRRCAWVPQSLGLFAHMSVRDNIAYARLPPFDVSAIADACGVAHLLDRRTPTLSRGEQSRVALARALAAEPDILLLDEPFAALDDESRSAAAAVVQSQHRARGFTLLHVTHDEMATRRAFEGCLIRRLRLDAAAGSISIHG